MNSRTRAFVVPVLSSFVVLAVVGATRAGDLEPPGSPAPTMKSLSEIEPRVPVQSLPRHPSGVYVISEPGSYYLAGNIVGHGGMTAISIEASDVVLDLNGFALLGMDEGDTGINVIGGRSNVAIRNGIIRGWPVNGIFGVNCINCEASDLLLEDNGSRVSTPALWMGRGGAVRRVTVRNTANGPGVQMDFNGRIESSIATGNRVGFYLAGDTSSISDSIATNNDEGLHLEANSVARRCVASFNGHGFEVVGGGEVVECQAFENGEGAVVWGTGARIEDNLFVGHGTTIRLGDGAARTRVAGNRIACGDAGIGVLTEGSTGHLVAGNSFTGCATELSLDPGSAVGELLDLTSGGVIDSDNASANIRF